ncbi:MAG TPA: hypothetical protein VGL55_07270 [Steroidobacteraceae bacterium]|jgi:hypothetical protein
MRRPLVPLLLLVCSGMTIAKPVPFPVQVHFDACDDGLICFPVEVSGGRSLTFLLDTGDVHSYVTAESARELGWPLQPVTGRDGKPIEGIVQAGERTVRLGSLNLKVRLLAFPRADLGPPKHRIVFDGAIAFTDLKDRVVQVDYARHRLRISDILTDSDESPLRGTLRTITFGQHGPAILTGGPFDIDGRPVQAQIDTCYTGTLLVYDAALSKLHLQALAGASDRSRFFPNTDGGVTMRAAKAQNVRFADYELGGTHPVIYLPTPKVHQPDGLFEATVGNALLSRSVLTLDLHHMKFDVSPASKPSPAGS